MFTKTMYLYLVRYLQYFCFSSHRCYSVCRFVFINRM